MSYHVDLQAIPSGHSVPPLLTAFADWLVTQEHGSVGWFDALAAQEIPATWDEANAARLQQAGFAFLSLPEGSLLALLDTGSKGASNAVVLLGSEGEARTVANSLEELLLSWSKGETDIDELDDDEASSGRPAMKAWLKQAKVKAPKAQDFDFQAWLDGASGGVASAKPAPPGPERPVPEVFATLPPGFRTLADLIGRRADDPRVIDYVTNEMGSKVPSSATDMGTGKEVKSKKGFSLWFSHDHLNDAFPLIAKTKQSFLPYVSQVAFTEKWPEALPFGLEWRHGRADIEARLGASPIEKKLFEEDDDSPILTWWERDVDPGRTYLKMQLKKKGLSVDLLIRTTTPLSSRHGVPAKPVVGLFVAWALSRGFIDESRFPQHRALIDRVKTRAAKGSALVDAAMPRGLWRDHLVPNEAVRAVASNLFHEMGGLSLNQDLIDVFGERTNEHSHREPMLDDDSWDAVDKAAAILDGRFAARVRE